MLKSSRNRFITIHLMATGFPSDYTYLVVHPFSFHLGVSTTFCTVFGESIFLIQWANYLCYLMFRVTTT